MPVIEVNGIPTYYEKRGAGPPVVLLHGAAMVVEGWEAHLADLSTGFTVCAPERRGVGRTPDGNGPWSYRGMAEDTAAFMDALGIREASVVGLSDGGNIALILAFMRPDLVTRLAVSGANSRPEGLGEFGSEVESMTPATLLEAAPPQVQDWLAIHRRVSPDGGAGLLASFEKMKRMWLDYEIPAAQLASIEAPTLVIAGDQDLIPLSHTAEIWSAIPGSQLCIVPGATHFWMQELPAVANAILRRFLTD